MRILILIAALSFATPSVRAEEPSLDSKLNKIIKSSGISREALGLIVVDLNDQKTLLAVNEQRPMIPASTTKLATAAAVLDKFGPSHKFVTTLWSAAEQSGETLQGDLILKGGGDPGFVSETMWFLVNDFYRNGIRKISGDLVVDDTYFDSIRTDPSRDPGRVDRAYDAPIGAMSFNWNSVNVFLRPRKVGEKVEVHIDPDLDGWAVRNSAKTKNGGGNGLEVSRVGDGLISVSGALGVDSPEVPVYKNISDPPLWAGQNLVYFLRQRGITVQGKVRLGKTPEKARQLAKAEGKPVSHHVADMLKFSNNYVAEMLTKSLAAQFVSTPARLEDGMGVVRSFLTSSGFDKERFVVINPSGLSRKNRVAPRDMAELLIQMSRKFTVFPEFLSGLPLAGVDGTLKSRMKNSSATGWVRAKTGLLTGAVGLAGYAGRKDGSMRAFVFLFNGNGEQGETARNLFDRLATSLVE